MSDSTTRTPCEPEPMSSVDRAWLEMDTADNPMVVTSIMEFESVADAGALARVLVEKTLRERRFRQRVVVGEDGARCWLEDDGVHLGYHVRTHRLEGPAPQRRLRAAIAAECARPLDRALPLWRITLINAPAASCAHGGPPSPMGPRQDKENDHATCAMESIP